MTVFDLRKRALKAGVAVPAIALLGFAAPAIAQEDLGEPTDFVEPNDFVEPAEAVPTGAIIVTGSRIVRPNVDATNPITSITVTDLTTTGEVNLGDALNDLPSLRSTFSQQNSTRFIGTAGLNLLDLRGLGTNRTLVLVNGRRHITAQPGVPTSVDVNTMPVGLVERVDILTGGSSAVYGADAVAGVVNFILRRDFDGIEGIFQSGLSDKGDRGTYLAALTAGTNFGDGRGNIAVSGEYSFADDLYYTDRDDVYGGFSGRNQLQLVDDQTDEGPNASDGIPDRVFVRNVRNLNISEGGLFTASCPSGGTVGDPRCVAGSLGATFVFDQSGNLVRNTNIADFRGVGSGNGIGGLGSSLQLTGQLAPQVERKIVNVLGHFEISPAFRPFVEAKYARIDAVQEGQATFHFNTFSLNNPFLTTQARNQLATLLPATATSFSAFRFNVDFGGRGEDHTRETYRIVGGIDGFFNDDWQYEVAVNYGKLETFYRTEGNIIRSRFSASMNAVRNAAGNIVCAINADANPANDDPACVPVNLFGFGAPSQAAINYFGVASTREQEATQLQATAFVGGDLSQLFELPGGPIQFAIGGEYRRETAYSAFDELTRSGVTFLNAIPVFDPDPLKVYEAYGELRIPILAGLPFAEELTIEAAGRVSDYNLGQTGTVYTYNLGGIYSPVPSLRIRGGYSRSVRVPTQSDLQAAPSQTFLNGLVDPCSQDNINQNPNRRANCAADGVPTTFTTPGGVTVPFNNRPNSGIRGLSGSNPNLDEERADSWTAGAVFTPEFIPGLVFTADYYNIEINNVIFSLAAQTIINLCYDSPTGIDNQYCNAVFRRPDGTFEGQSDIRLPDGSIVAFPPLQPGDRSFIAGPFNFARQKTSGIDFDLSYTRDLGGVEVYARGLLSYVIERDNFTNVDDPDFIDQQLLELGDPEFAGSFTLGLDFGLPRITYNLRYIGEQFINSFETFNPLNGLPPQNPDYSEPRVYPETFYHNLRLNLEKDRWAFYIGVDNLLDTNPPLGLDGTGSGSGQYDNIGRFIYTGARINF